ncbi:MAG: hypothetical protein H7X80_03805, partial [bacterium]|nr:hypothetical protein [Candidatus Kapabacteria bacterium]
IARAPLGGGVDPYTGPDPATVYDWYRLPDTWISRAHLSREFPLADLLGAGVGRSAIIVALDVENFLNMTGPADYYRDLSGLSSGPDFDVESIRVKGDFSATLHYQSADAQRPETYSRDQYDVFGARLYNAYIDDNLDGVVTQDEKFSGYQRWVSTRQSLRENYQFPRQAYLRVGFRF